jgi:hypothetical protein
VGTARRCRLLVPLLNKPSKTKTYEIAGPRPPRFQAPFATGREVYTNFRRVLPPPLAEGFTPRGPCATKPQPVVPRPPPGAAGRPYTIFSGSGFTATSRTAISSAMTTNTPVNKATPGHPAWLQATPPADPKTLEPTYKKNR